MGKYFDDIHASWQSQLEGAPCELTDSKEVSEARSSAVDFDGFVALGDALSKQLRYREAAQAYTSALGLRPDDLSVLRLRAGRYLSTLQLDGSCADLDRCLELGGDKLDILYRLGLCAYFNNEFDKAATNFKDCFPLCDDEMGIAVIYWHSLTAFRSAAVPELLEKYHSGMEVGHHTAYEKAVSVFSGAKTEENVLAELEDEAEDLEYVIALYGICDYLRHIGKNELAEALEDTILVRDGFWPCYAWLAAWNDRRRKEDTDT